MLQRSICLVMLLICITRTPFSYAAEIAPEASSGILAKEAVTAAKAMVVSANPYASQVGLAVLQQGGSAIDAAIATQMVLNVVEPQSSGIGGGGFLLYYDAKTKEIKSYDGRETAPLSATSSLFLQDDGSPMGFFDAVKSGKSVGVPGLLKMLSMVHQRHGSLEWSSLFEPAIVMAEEGFPMPERMETVLDSAAHAKESLSIRQWLVDGGNFPKAGETITNPELADTFTHIAEHGATEMYQGAIAQAIVSAVKQAGGGLSEGDMKAYQAKQREAVCAPYRGYRVCGMGPPSSGGVTALQILSLLTFFDLGEQPTAQAWHLITEAMKLAYADRNTYLADSDFVHVPITKMLDREYLRSRAAMITPSRASGVRQAGVLYSGFASHAQTERPSTTHISVIDAQGNAVSLTSSIEHAFGSGHMVKGFLLNNQLTDFAFTPEKHGIPVANRVEPEKRPRSSMSPMLVFDKEGALRYVIGSPGGARIIPYVTTTLIRLIDWKEAPQQAVAAPHILNLNSTHTELEENRDWGELPQALEALGHNVTFKALTSGIHLIAVAESGTLEAGADPRREGVALGY